MYGSKTWVEQYGWSIVVIFLQFLTCKYIEKQSYFLVKAKRKELYN